MRRPPTATLRADGALRSLCVQDMPVRTVQPCAEVAIASKSDELVAEAVAVAEGSDVSAEPCLYLIHKLRMRDLGVHADRDEVV